MLFVLASAGPFSLGVRGGTHARKKRREVILDGRGAVELVARTNRSFVGSNGWLALQYSLTNCAIVLPSGEVGVVSRFTVCFACASALWEVMSLVSLTIERGLRKRTNPSVSQRRRPPNHYGHRFTYGVESAVPQTVNRQGWDCGPRCRLEPHDLDAAWFFPDEAQNDRNHGGHTGPSG